MDKSSINSPQNWEEITQNIRDYFSSHSFQDKQKETLQPGYQEMLERLWQLDREPERVHSTELQDPWYQSFKSINASWNIQFNQPKVSGTPDNEEWFQLLKQLEKHQRRLFPPFEIVRPPIKKRLVKWPITQIRKIFHRLITPYLHQFAEYQHTILTIQQEFNHIISQLQNEIINRMLIERQVSFNAEIVRLLNQIIQNILFSRQKKFNMIVKELLKHLPESIEENSRALDQKISQIQQDKLSIQVIQRELTRLFEQLDLLSRKGNQGVKEGSAEGSEVPPDAATEERKTTLAGSSKYSEDSLYFHFENAFRGSFSSIKENQKKYLPYFKGCTNIVDIGCGRGEFLELLKQEQIPAIGIDNNSFMVAHCQEKGLEVFNREAFSYLEELADASIDGIFCSQFVEHFDDKFLLRFLQLCRKKLKADSYIIIETPNPQNIITASTNFVRDISHVKLYHPDTLKFILEFLGFDEVIIEKTSIVGEEHCLREVPHPSNLSEIDSASMESIIQNFHLLSFYLCSPQDYAIIGKQSGSKT